MRLKFEYLTIAAGVLKMACVFVNFITQFNFMVQETPHFVLAVMRIRSTVCGSVFRPGQAGQDVGGFKTCDSG